MKNPGKLGRIIPKSDYREREKWPRHTVYKALPMGDIGGSVDILHIQTIPMAVKHSDL